MVEVSEIYLWLRTTCRMVTERDAPENRCDWDVEAGARGDQDPLRVKELQREDLAARYQLLKVPTSYLR